MKITKEDIKNAVQDRFVAGLDVEQQSAIIANYVAEVIELKMESVKKWVDVRLAKASQKFEHAEANRLEDGDVAFDGSNYMEEMSYNEGIIEVLKEFLKENN
jgi:hypothetical protein